MALAAASSGRHGNQQAPGAGDVTATPRRAEGREWIRFGNGFLLFVLFSPQNSFRFVVPSFSTGFFFYANCGRRFLFALIDDSTPVASHRNDNEKDTQRERERESHEIEKRRHWSSSRSLPSFAVPGFVCVRRTQMRWHLVMQMSRDAVQSASPIANDALRLAGDVVSARQASSSFRSSFVFVCFVLFFVFFFIFGAVVVEIFLVLGRTIDRPSAIGRRSTTPRGGVDVGVAAPSCHSDAATPAGVAVIDRRRSPPPPGSDC